MTSAASAASSLSSKSRSSAKSSGDATAKPRRRAKPSQPQPPTGAPESQPTTSLGRASAFQSFETREVHRRDLKNAPYNPRTINRHARKTLQRLLKKKGLLSALTWNKRTGNLVAGHRRLEILDALEKDDDWHMTVCVVDLSLEEEVEANISMNNEQAMGEYDRALLEDALRTPKIDLDMTGFDRTDLEVLFPGADFVKGLFADERRSESLNGIISELDELKEERDAEREAKRKQEQDEADAAEAERKKAHVKKRKGEMRQAVSDNDDGYYAVVVFRSTAQREAFMKHVGEDADSEYVDGDRVASFIEGFELPPYR